MLKNIDEQYGKVEFKAPLVVAPQLCVDELKAEERLGSFKKYSGFNLMIMLQRVARTGYENILYLERPGCNLCMGNKKKKAEKRGYSVASTRLSRKSCGRF
jgi:aconitate hydratase 2/2-methylisocitrate dehydratase